MKIALTGDWHYGCTTHSSIHAETQLPQRLIDCENTIRAVFRECDQRGVRNLFVMGDIFHVNNPPSTYIARLIVLFYELLEAHKHVVVHLYDGNHDHNGKPGMTNATAALVHALKANGRFVFYPPDRVSTLLLDKDKETVALQAAIFPHACGSERYRFEDQGCPNVVMAHTSIEGAVSGVESTLLADEARSLGVIEGPISAYWTGHIHKAQQFIYKGVPVVYPGSIERIDFGERADQKGFVIATVDGDKIAYETVPLKTRAFVQHTVVVQRDWTPAGEPWPDAGDAVMKVRVKVKESDLGLFNASEVRAYILQHVQPNYLSGFEMDIDRERQVRDEGMTERLTVSDAFDRYVERNLPVDTAQERAFRDRVVVVGREAIAEARNA